MGYNPPNENKLNGSILNVASLIKNVVASAAESEVGACFQNAKTAAPLLVTLSELSRKQMETPPMIDNSTDYGILNEAIKQKRSTSMDMKYYWLQDRVPQKKIDVYWPPGKDNLADYHTKHHPAQHHKDMRPILLNKANILDLLRGCAKLLHTKLRQPTDTHTSQNTLRATQVRSALAHAYTILLQNRPLRHLL
jgi:hypothetical protein